MDKHKAEIIQSLNSFLSPLSKAINELTYIVETGESLEEEKFLILLSDILTSTAEADNMVVEKISYLDEKGPKYWDEEDSDLFDLLRILTRALKTLNKGSANLLYVLYMENPDFHDENYVEQLKKIIDESPNIELVIDQLYDGSRLLIDVIDDLL